MRKIKIAQIGMNAYSHSSQIFKSITKQSDVFDVVGYVLPEGEKERLSGKMKVLEGYPELTLDEVLNSPEIEAVTIETDEIYLTKYALLAAQAGKHVHMEKPGGTKLSDFEKLINAMRQSGKVFHTGYMYRYNPYIIELLQRIQNGELGEILSVEAQMSIYQPKEHRQFFAAFPGGMTFHLGCHLIDLVLQIQGQPKKIYPFNRCSGLDGVTGQDVTMTVFDYGNAVSFVKTSACELGGYARRQLVVSGTKETVELKPLEMRADVGTLYTGKTQYTGEKWYDTGVSARSADYDRYDAMMRAFAQYVAGEKQNPYTLDYELELYQTILKCCEADA